MFSVCPAFAGPSLLGESGSRMRYIKVFSLDTSAAIAMMLGSICLRLSLSSLVDWFLLRLCSFRATFSLMRSRSKGIRWLRERPLAAILLLIFLSLASTFGGRPVDAFVGAPSHHVTRWGLRTGSKALKLEYDLFLYKIGFSSSTWLIGGDSGAGAAISCGS